MKTIERKLGRYENTISKKSRKSVAAVRFHTDKPGEPDAVRIILAPAKGNRIWDQAPDIETAKCKLEALTRDFVNPVLVLFAEKSEALEDKRTAWYNTGGNTLQGNEYLLNEPRGRMWSEILHRGKWAREIKRKQET